MTYDAGVSGSYLSTSHSGQEIKNVYGFPTGNVSYTSTPDDNSFKSHAIGAFFKALYQADKTVISNIIGIQRSRSPLATNKVTEYFDSPLYTGGSSQTGVSSSGLSGSWNGTYQFFMPKSYTLVITPKAAYASYNNFYTYISPVSSIDNDANEHTWDVSLSANLQKAIGRHSVYFALSGSTQGNNIYYHGSNPATVKGRYYDGAARLGAALNFKKFSLQPSVSLVIDHTDFGTTGFNQIFPKIFLYATYQFSSKSLLNLSLERYNYTSPFNERSPNLQILNQIEGIMGNPDLKDGLCHNANLSYQIYPAKNLLLNAYGIFNRFSNTHAYIYTPAEIGGHQFMIRRMINSGFQNGFLYGVRGTIRLLRNALTATVSLGGATFNQHGPMPYKGTNLTYSMQASYSIGNLYISAAYFSDRKSITTPYITKSPHYYNFTIGWSNGDLNISAEARSPFSSSYPSQTTEINSENYRSLTRSFSPAYHRAFGISLTYSFPYGKKLGDSTEATAPANPQSAILKKY